MIATGNGTDRGTVIENATAITTGIGIRAQGGAVGQEVLDGVMEIGTGTGEEVSGTEL